MQPSSGGFPPLYRLLHGSCCNFRGEVCIEEENHLKMAETCSVRGERRINIVAY
jgi:hypothetical protein